METATKQSDLTNKREADIHEEITKLKGQLTGNLFEDGETQQQIYELKKLLNPQIVDNPEMDIDDEGCLYCGS